ncbi:MFS transporter [Mesorhizobium sp. CAU 1741]|uniref:MFS transporter n=1 Tax=Mesorhizobium sp. CAU 1741 TaxID=3140366 RepID=UPI00325B59C5
MTPSPFGRFVAASGLTNLGDGIATVAWAWVASLLTRDPLLIASVAVALRLPWALLALPAGVVTDRVDRRLLILRMDILRALAFAAAAAALWVSLPLAEPPQSGVAAPWTFCAVVVAAAIVGGAEVFRDNAAQTMLPSMVPHERLESANGRLWSVELTTNALLGPAIGAFLIAVAVPLPFAANALAYGLAALLIAGLAGSFRPEADGKRNWQREIGEGLRFLAGAPLLRMLAWITGFWNLFHQMIFIALVLHVQENLGLGAPAYGLILAAGAAGGIAGGLLGERIVRRLGPGRTAQWMLFSSAPAFVAAALAPGAVSLAVVLAVFEFSGMVWNTVSVSYRQRTIPDRLLGRVNSVYRLLAWGMMPIGLVLSGALVAGLDGILPRTVALTVPFYVAAVGVLVVTIIGWRGLGRGFSAQKKPVDAVVAQE